MSITLADADHIIEAALAAASSETGPITVVVIDAGGVPKAFKKQDGGGLLDFEIAFGRAFAALSLSPPSSAQLAAFRDRAPGFRVLVEAVARESSGRMIVEPGGARIAGADKMLLGALGIAGPVPDTCHELALEALKRCGFSVS